jgi:hypothetical protein
MSSRPKVAVRHSFGVGFGPEAPGWGSWEWVGADIAEALGSHERSSVCTFRAWDIPEAEVVVIVKHRPPEDWIDFVARRSAIIYAPVDNYDAVSSIDGDLSLFRRCSRIVIHCERLRRYFATYAPVEYIDHHVKFSSPLRQTFSDCGNVIWVGVRSNLAPLVDWVNSNPLPAAIDIMSNFEDPSNLPSRQEIGFRDDVRVNLLMWSPEAQAALVAGARAAIDIKGEDFRSRYKPPAKAIDFLASGVPLAMNAASSPVEHLARLGFDIACPTDWGRWLSRDYWEQTRLFGVKIKERLSLERVASRWLRVIEDVRQNVHEV